MSHLLQVVKEVYSGCSGPVDSECPPPSSSPVHKVELEKVRGMFSLGPEASQRLWASLNALSVFSEAFSPSSWKRKRRQVCSLCAAGARSVHSLSWPS